jgi:hypothetical protein
MKKYKYLFFLMSLLVLIGGTASLNFVHADDDEDRYEQDDDERATTSTTTTSVPTTSSTKEKIKYVNQTIVVTPERIVTENQLQTTSFPDRDRDGIIDSEDAHPDIAEIYIVQDSNLNGIVDTFEYAK